jgi:hypothetical protein
LDRGTFAAFRKSVDVTETHSSTIEAYDVRQSPLILNGFYYNICDIARHVWPGVKTLRTTIQKYLESQARNANVFRVVPYTCDYYVHENFVDDVLRGIRKKDAERTCQFIEGDLWNVTLFQWARACQKNIEDRQRSKWESDWRTLVASHVGRWNTLNVEQQRAHSESYRTAMDASSSVSTALPSHIRMCRIDQVQEVLDSISSSSSSELEVVPTTTSHESLSSKKRKL